MDTRRARGPGRSCAARSGYNRTGRVVARMLIETGLSAAEAVALVRRRRSPGALGNDAFTGCLAAGLDAAVLLVERDPLG
ncbi:hypothetical protein [Streptomyces vinaceus]|uniref:hypothetical protein n=1 Tax=Streptomyces vinaceus TaxID=1960 RepID=UPI00380035AA